MFGKNKKNKKSSNNEEKATGRIVMHTMEDDLNSDYDMEDKKPSSIYKDNLKKVSSDKYKSTEIKSPFLESSEKNIFKKEVTASGFPQKTDDKPLKSKVKPTLEQMWGGKKLNSYDNNEDRLSKAGVTIEDRLTKIKKASLKKSENKYETIKEVQKNTENIFKKTAYIGLFLAIVAVIGIGGYYLFTNKEQIMSLLHINSVVNNNEKKIENNQVNIKKDPEYSFSDKSNFLMINNFTKNDIIKSINQTFDKMPENELLEFVVTDKDNIQLLFSEFSNILDLKLSPDIMKNLGDDFSVFLYKKSNDNKRISLVVDISNKELLSGSISMDSDNLVQAIEPLFLGAQVSQSKVMSGFNTSIYNGNNIRYNNIGKDSDLSIDYMIIGNKFILATSKDSGRLIIDKLVVESGDTEEQKQGEITNKNSISEEINDIEGEEDINIIVDTK